MKKIELVYRELLFREIEKGIKSHTQKGISEKLGLSLSTVNQALKPLRKMNAISVKPRAFSVVNPEKILFYWASVRNLQKDIVLKARVEMSAREIERCMPDNAAFTCYSGFKFSFGEVPADYSEVYVYAPAGEIEKRFSFVKGAPNLFVLKMDDFVSGYGKANTKAGLFVDLWNCHEWYAKDYLKAWRLKMHGLLE